MRRGFLLGTAILALAFGGPRAVAADAASARPDPPPQAPRVRTVRVPGATLAYAAQGRGEPVVFLHGWLWDYRVWSNQLPDISRRYRAIAYSRRYNYPNAPTGGGADYSTATDVADLVALIKTLRLGPVHLVGHSAGGTIALLVARDHPELVRSLTLAEAGAGDLAAANPEVQAQLQRLFTIVDEAFGEFQKGDLRGAARILAGGIVGQMDAFDRMPPERQRQVLDNMPLEMKAQLVSSPKPKPAFSCADARGIKVPTLLVEGERTLPLFVLVDEELLTCIPGSRREILPGATHALQLEKPTEFNRILLRFLSSQSHPTPGTTESRSRNLAGKD